MLLRAMKLLYERVPGESGQPLGLVNLSAIKRMCKMLGFRGPIMDEWRGKGIRLHLATSRRAGLSSDGRWDKGMASPREQGSWARMRESAGCRGRRRNHTRC